MENLATYTVYNASAGSGKTYTLVRDFLAILLKQKDAFYFRQVLAITFTNKASAEMKQRILENLQCFSTEAVNDMKRELMLLSGLDATTFAKRSQVILEAILQDYSSLNITTIDSFTHRIIRSFAFDFGLTSDFDVELDAAKILQEAVDVVISKIGIDEKLTQVLVSFALQKSDEDKSWDISKNLFEFSKILLNETDKKEFESIADVSLEDFNKLRQNLISAYKKIEENMSQIGANALDIIAQNDLEAGDFYRSMLPNFFKTLSNNWENAKFFDENTLRQNMEDGIFYAKSKSDLIKSRIDQISPQLSDLYFKSEKLFPDLILHQLWIESIFPMTVLKYVFEAMENLKKDYNIQLISDFNDLIQKKIKDEPAPFIYERLGEKFKHYFIDEMQDTSTLQWQNLLSLIENALSQEGGSLLLVGDTKQSIYRWRGSNPEQFMTLSDPQIQGPFQVDKNVLYLDTNYRSFTEIIKFNNDFFAHIANALQNEGYGQLYEKETFQKSNTQKGGYVQIDFLIKDKEDDEKSLLYPKKVLDILKNLDPAWAWKDVCVLVRKNAQGIAIAQYLTQNGIAIISSESLLLSQNPTIVFLIQTIRTLYNPRDLESRFDMLNFLYTHLAITESRHAFYEKLMPLEVSEFYDSLTAFHLEFKYEKWMQKSLYDGLEYLIRSFKLNTKSDVYIQFFLDYVMEFQAKNGSDWSGFLDDWELKKEKLSISIPEGKNAVRIMTVHKAKGLQFPVVIFPYDLSIYEHKFEKVWYDLEKATSYEGISKLLIKFDEKLKYTDAIGKQLHTHFREKQELDNFNLLYVALTRAIEQLYVVTDFGLNSQGQVKMKYYSGLFTRFLQSLGLYQESQLQYCFGSQNRMPFLEKKEICIVKKPINEDLEHMISTELSEHKLVFYTKSSLLWDTEQGKAIHFGNLIHEMLSQIITTDDIPMVVRQYTSKGLLTLEESMELQGKLEAMCKHPQLQKYFDQPYQVKCESELFTPDGSIHIPDRIVFFNEKEVGILDYKTGIPSETHQFQIDLYAQILTDMGFEVVEKWLVYIGDQMKII